MRERYTGHTHKLGNVMSRVYSIGLALVLVSSAAHAATAYWTGRQEMVQTVTNQMAWRCEYEYMSKTYWVMFPQSPTFRCPATVQLQ